MKIIAVIALVLTLFNLDLLDYGFSQLRGQLHITTNARPIEEVFDDPATPDSIKKKLLLIQDIKQFAVDSLGLKPTKNYTTYYDQHGKAVLMVLTASEKYKLEAYDWKFPILGTVSYKGFFDFKKGDEEKKKLEKEGYDTDYSPTGAWSTLGWFRDPIFSGMLRRNIGQIAELIIHEMTHGTIYLKSSVDFNENLASVIGEEGAIRFLAFKYGSSSPEMTTYINSKEDYDFFSAHMLHGASMLDSLYQTFKDSTTEKEKLAQKKKLIGDIVLALDTVSFHDREKYLTLFWEKYLPNNAYFMGFKRYDAQKDEMRRELRDKYHNEFRKYLESLRNRKS